MKKLISIISCGLLLWACGSGDRKDSATRTIGDVQQEFISTLSASDTTYVLTLANQVLDSLKAGNIQWALETICDVDSTGAVIPLSEERRESIGRRFERFPVVDYELDYYDFSMPGLNDLKYRTFFAERDESGRAPSMSLMFNPVKDGGEWYLCLKEASQPAADAANALNPDLIVEGK